MNTQRLLEKISNAQMKDYPFKHLVVENFFELEDFEKIISSPEINIGKVGSDVELFKKLDELSYEGIPFPGAITDKNEYLKWHKSKVKTHKIDTAVESFGFVLRLNKAKSEIIEKLINFMNSNDFKEAIANRFDVDYKDKVYDAGIQKYLDGYEISPHTDIRRKALTYLVNINPDPNSEKATYHTNYCMLKPQWKYVQSYWKEHNNVDRCWVPWGWCEVIAKQTANNSIVIFAPSDDTMHAVDAKYDHLNYQRTQYYGNFWYDNFPKLTSSKWEDYVITHKTTQNFKDFLKNNLPEKIVKSIKEIKAQKNKVGKRNIEI